MTKSKPSSLSEAQYPFADTEAAIILRSALDQYVRRNKSSLRKLATTLGYKQSTVLSHMASGRVAIPIDRAAEFADHLDIARAVFLPIVLKQRHPDVLEAVKVSAEGSEMQIGLLASVNHDSVRMTKKQQKIVQEMVRDSCPEERWLTPSEVPLVNYFRNEVPEIFEHGLNLVQLKLLKEAIQSILS